MRSTCTTMTGQPQRKNKTTESNETYLPVGTSRRMKTPSKFPAGREAEDCLPYHTTGKEYDNMYIVHI